MGKNPAKWKGPRNSVEMVSWDEANEFCKKVTEELRKRKLLRADEVIRLPTEAEWEYCCRAGTTTAFSFGDAKDIKDHCWYNENSKGYDPPVGKKKPNAWGLYDMHGYVWEWCADWYGDYSKETATDPQGPKTGKERVMRGASYADPAERCRSAAR